MSRRPLGFELALVVVVSLGVLAPGIWSYSLVDPWETHYGEVGREILQNHDWVHLQWFGGMTPTENEGFRSKPVLTFWMIATSLRALGLAKDGGYSGELAASARTAVALRLPFLLCAVFGLAMMWWMLARLCSRRLAWLALLVVGSCPFYALVARQAIPDMPLVACLVGALALFAMATEDGDRPVSRFGRSGRLDARHVVLGLAGGFVVVQAIYFAWYFATSPQLAVRTFAPPAIWLPALMVIMLAALSRPGWLVARLPLVLVGGVIATARGVRPSGSPWQVLQTWERDAPDRYLVRALALPAAGSWRATEAIADRALELAPITTMRQVYLLGCYALLGVSILAKGPPGLGVAGLVGVAYIVLLGKWRELYDGGFELKRGLVLMIVTFLPWHLAMFLKDGLEFINQYLLFHVLERAGSGVDSSPGTFEYYTSQLGHGMWLWAALLPAAIGAGLVRTGTQTPADRVRWLAMVWAITGVAMFGLVQTKFHHYILPVVPALGIVVAFFLDDLVAGRDRLHPLFAALGVAIVLLIARDLAWQPQRWIEMFIFRYDRPWPNEIDPSDGFLALGALAAAAIVLTAMWRRIGVVALAVAGVAIAGWALMVYMPIAGNHWGMREAVRAYYAHRTIYGQQLVYFGRGELYDDWRGVTDHWRFETAIPDELQLGQPMTIQIQLHRADDPRITEQRVELVGQVTAIGDHAIDVTFAPGERSKLDPLVVDGPRGAPPVRAVDADRLIASQLYWRGENFWTGDEIYGWLPELHTSLYKAEDFTKYFADRTISPLGRRYFVLTEAGRITSVPAQLPTERAKGSFRVLDTSSNKYAIGAFYL